MNILETNFRDTHHTSHRPKLLQPEPRLLEKLLEMSGRSLHTVNGRHQPQVPIVAVSKMVAIVSRQRIRSRCNLRAPKGGIHDRIADEYLRFGSHDRFQAFQDLDTVAVRPIVSIAKKSEGLCKVNKGKGEITEYHATSTRRRL